MVKDLVVALFAIASGFTVSGIVLNGYRLISRQQATLESNVALMALAGPNVLIETAATSLRSRKCTGFAFWLATAVSTYWSFVLGLFLLNLVVAFKPF